MLIDNAAGIFTGYHLDFASMASPSSRSFALASEALNVAMPRHISWSRLNILQSIWRRRRYHWNLNVDPIDQ